MNGRQDLYQYGEGNGEQPSPQPIRRPHTPLKADYAWLDGNMVSFEDATVHFLNPTLHYGPGVFEGIRCYNTPSGPAVFRLHEHLERFLNSASVLGVDELLYDVEELRDAICRLIRINNFTECYIRPALFFEGPLSLNLDDYRPVVGIADWEWNNYLGQEALADGIRMMVSSITRMHPNASMTKAKINGQYVNSILAKTMAARAGFDEAIMLDPEGYVAEATGENLLLVRDNSIYTAPRASILEGITRDSIIILARDAGYTVVEERISRDQLYIADEVLVCGTAAEVLAVREIDYRKVGNGGIGPVASQLQRLFIDTVNGLNRRSPDWLDYMVLEPVI